jgi:hypothetical protein
MIVNYWWGKVIASIAIGVADRLYISWRIEYRKNILISNWMLWFKFGETKELLFVQMVRSMNYELTDFNLVRLINL